MAVFCIAVIQHGLGLVWCGGVEGIDVVPAYSPSRVYMSRSMRSGDAEAESK